MSEDNYQNSIIWRRRLQLIQRLRKLTIFSIVLSILIPAVCFAVLFSMIRKQEQEIEKLTKQVESLTKVSIEQQNRLGQWEENGVTSSREEASVDQVGAEVSENETESLESNILETKTPEAGSLTEAIQESEEERQAAHKVYLTFDDGPSKNTDDILAILDKYQVKATFFVVGKEDEVSQELMCDIVDAGHTIGLHSYSHNYSQIYNSVEDFAADFKRQQDYVYEVTEVKSTVYRFPGGSSNTISDVSMQEFADYLETQGVEYFDWNISSGDGGSYLMDTQIIVNNCTKNIQNFGTSFILMHYSAEKSTSVESLPIIIENILAMEDTVILPITENTKPVHHIDADSQD